MSVYTRDKLKALYHARRAMKASADALKGNLLDELKKECAAVNRLLDEARPNARSSTRFIDATTPELGARLDKAAGKLAAAANACAITAGHIAEAAGKLGAVASLAPAPTPKDAPAPIVKALDDMREQAGQGGAIAIPAPVAERLRLFAVIANKTPERLAGEWLTQLMDGAIVKMISNPA